MSEYLGVWKGGKIVKDDEPPFSGFHEDEKNIIAILRSARDTQLARRGTEDADECADLLGLAADVIEKLKQAFLEVMNSDPVFGRKGKVLLALPKELYERVSHLLGPGDKP